MGDSGLSKTRILLVASAVLIVAACFVMRLLFLQVLYADYYRTRARTQQQEMVSVQGPRGTLWDRNGHELAVSIETTSAFVHPGKIRTASEKESIVRGVAAALRTPESEIRSLIEDPKNYRFVYLRRRLGPRETKAIQDLHIPSIGLMSENRRFYPRGVLAAHLLGFVDIDGKGQAGIERGFDRTVRGEPTTFISLMDARQRPLLMRVDRPGGAGHDLVLTIDETIQHLAEVELDRTLEETEAKGGTIIVMDPGSGEILALANRPGFDPNAPGGAPGSNRENFAVSYGYEPGSTFKVITAAAALEEKRARPTDIFDCGMGSITLYGRRIGDHHSYGALTLAQIISKSSNVGIIRVGQRLTAQTFCDYVQKFGFGKPTGVELPSEAPGVVQLPGRRTWSGLSQPMMSMGQSIVVTPLQMLTAVATIAGGGVRRAPRIVRAITGPDGTPEPLPGPPPVKVLSEDTARTLATMMEGVVDEGTGKAAVIPGYRVAGKTGTAQKVIDGVYSHSAHVASFVGFVPAGRPALCAIVVLDEPVGRYYGGDVAAPAFARVVGPALAYLRVPPTEPISAPAPPPQVLRARAEASAARRAATLKARAAEPEEDTRHPRPFPAPWPPSVVTAAGVVPDLFGLSLRDALHELAKSGCRPRVTGSGFVIEQSPIPGTALTPGPDSSECLVVLAPEPPQGGGRQQGS